MYTLMIQQKDLEFYIGQHVTFRNCAHLTGHIVDLYVDKAVIILTSNGGRTTSPYSNVIPVEAKHVHTDRK